MEKPYNPAAEAEPLANAAKLWELLRRNDQFRQDASEFPGVAQGEPYAEVALTWTGKPVFQPGIKRSTDGPVLTRAEAKGFRPLTADTAWPQTPERFQEEFRRAVAHTLSESEAGGLAATTEAKAALVDLEQTSREQLLMIHETHLCFGIPRGPHSPDRLERILQTIAREFRKHYAEPPGYRTSFLGSRPQWEAYLFLEGRDTGRGNAQALEAEWINLHFARSSQAHERKSRDTHLSTFKSICEHRDAIAEWIGKVYPAFTFKPPVQKKSRR